MIISTEIEKRELLKEFRENEKFLQDLKAKIKNGKVDDTDEAIYEAMTKKERTLKRKYVEKCHVTKDGTPKSIWFNESSGLWNAKVDGKMIRATSEDILYEKLFVLYGGVDVNYSFARVYELALLKRKVDSSDSNAYRINNTYLNCIPDEVKQMDIRHITPEKLDNIMMDIIMAKKLTTSGLNSVKILFNMVFDFAVPTYIQFNPLLLLKKEKAKYFRKCNENHIEDDKSNDLPMYPDQIEALRQEFRTRIDAHPNTFYAAGYAFMMSTYTGFRSAELCALKWKDIKYEENVIWVHRQQLIKDNSYYDVLWTKDDKAHEGKGRKYPLFTPIKNLLAEIKEKQEMLGIKSEYIFCNKDGSAIHTNNQYQQTLRKACIKLGYATTRNHAIRKYVNSFVLVPLGFNEMQRSELLGHSPRVNLEKYSFSTNDITQECFKRYEEMFCRQDMDEEEPIR